MFLSMQIRWLILGLFLPWMAFAQGVEDLSSLPSTKPEQKLPNLDEAEPKLSMPNGYNINSPSTSIPKLRLPAEDEQKSKSQDWAAQGMQEKQEAAKKKQMETVAQEEAKARKMLQQDSEKMIKKEEGGLDPVVAKNSVAGFTDSEKAKLPTVTGVDGVKSRASDSGDGRVQPTFDSFTGPSSSSPMGKDYQSGAKPIMPPSSGLDGRIMLPPKAPEPPSGAYKKISQDPYALPAKNESTKPVQQAKPKLEGKNPPAGNPLTPGAPAGYSPYDNNRIVPDPRSTRKF